MALDAATIRDLLKQLEADRKAYLASHERTLEILSHALPTSPRPSISQSISPPPAISAIPSRVRPGALDADSERKSSTFSGDDDDDSDDDESLFVQDTLPKEEYREEDLREHLKTHRWDEHARTILDRVLNDNLLFSKRDLFQSVGSDDRSQTGQQQINLIGHQVYEIGVDGAPLQYRRTFFGDIDRPPIHHRPSIHRTRTEETVNRDKDVWRDLSEVNADPAKTRPAVGRIAIIYEPSSITFAAVHCAYKEHFDMDEMFRMLVESDATKVHMDPFSADTRKQRSLIVSLHYLTIRAPDRKPMSWQLADHASEDRATDHVSISRCCSVVGLSLAGEPTSSVKNRARRAKTTTGKIYDPFAPWRVLSIQAFPDWKSTMAYHDGAKHFVNGPEAFLVTLLAEYRDAAKRLLEVNRQIAKLVTPPRKFMFDKGIRDKLLFEDDSYTFSRRYFWANQTLAIASDHIEAMVNTYRDTFTEDVWTGHHKLLWPGKEDVSARYSHWRRRMRELRNDFELAIMELEKIHEFNQREQKDIKSLRDQLFSGTSVLESRKSVQQTAITVQQGHNIKVLTLVSIFFLPLTFVTSIFGMTNMPPNENFDRFGIVTACICLPTYLLIGSLNTTKGMAFWREEAAALWKRLVAICAWIFGLFHQSQHRERALEDMSAIDEKDSHPLRSPFHLRSSSTEKAIAIRTGLRKPTFQDKTEKGRRVSSPLSSRSESTVKFHPSTSFDARQSIPMAKAVTLPHPRHTLEETPKLSSTEQGPLTKPTVVDEADSALPEEPRSGLLRRLSDRFEHRSAHARKRSSTLV